MLAAGTDQQSSSSRYDHAGTPLSNEIEGKQNYNTTSGSNNSPNLV